MFARRLCVFENISKQCAPALRYSQRRWAQVHDVRFLVTHQRADSITERYCDKLKLKAAQEGLQSVDELKTVYKARVQQQREKTTTKAAFPQPPPPPSPVAIGHSPTPSSSPSSKPSTPPGFKTLSSYLDLPKTMTLPPKEIEYIWRLRHANTATSLCAILPSSTYLRIQQTARKHPHFILPLPREGSTGAEIHFLQWSFPSPGHRNRRVHASSRVQAPRRVQPAAHDHHHAFGAGERKGIGADAGASGGGEGRERGRGALARALLAEVLWRGRRGSGIAAEAVGKVQPRGRDVPG
ncbi:hypothetical protein XPA_005592 [Xanthoria parietina]